MSYSKIVVALAAGLVAANAAQAVMPAPCVQAGPEACRESRPTGKVYPAWAFVAYPEASHIVYPEGIFVFGDR
jgi:hypothetical protein